MKKNDGPYLRVLDANYNRSKEAIRVMEDIARFVIGSPALMRECKRCRHDLTQVFLRLPVAYKKIVGARDARRDSGKDDVILDRRRPKAEDLMKANAKRSQEALRVLEEFSKVIAPRQSGAFQKIRFKLYELEKRSLSKF